MLRGLATVTLTATDVPAAARWYGDVLGIEPYFVRPVEGPPAYVEFRVGDDEDELGIMDARFAAWSTGAPAGAVVHWHVEDLTARVAQLQALGATLLQGVTERGEGFATSVLADPFGNVLGLMTNPHWRAAHES